MTCGASVLPLLHQRTLDASEFSRLNRRTCSRLSDVIGGPDDNPVRGSNPTSASRLPLSRLGQPDSIPALVLPSGGMAGRHRKGAIADRYCFHTHPVQRCQGRYPIPNIKLTETRGLRLPDESQEGRNRSWALEEFSATLRVVHYVDKLASSSKSVCLSVIRNFCVCTLTK
ncbi:hypothetical protein CSKR_106236 [Clonorchis sinensis]|uniref:Uncharacterized protein n=1 Tax=Clonorchis sinensis TaxID=79923 RepID=A0A419PSR9_CLOSI|nr:hypothetical protein CSKR_106236 [Clonorchis sinensis]